VPVTKFHPMKVSTFDIRNDITKYGIDTSVPIDWKTCPCELKVPLEERAGYVDVFCTSSQCPEQLTNKIHYFAGKNALKIDGLGKKIVQQLIDWNYVQSIPDIFSLRKHREEMILQPGWGEKSVDNLLQNIEKVSKLNA
jgi:DNA ligase (NAD+)